MRAFSIAAVLLLFSLQTFAVEPDANARLAESARTLDWQARKNLGVSVQHLALLLQAGPYSVFLKESLVKDGSWERFKELESKGFVSMQEPPSPDSAQGSTYVSFLPTAKGQAVLNALKGK